MSVTKANYQNMNFSSIIIMRLADCLLANRANRAKNLNLC